MGRALLPLLLVAVGLLPAAAQQPGKSFPPPRAIADAGNDLDVAYLPDRVVGAWEDRWVKLNVHWPKDGKQHPCIIFVHGGGYSGGDKDGGFAGAGGPDGSAMARAVRMGFVVANVNYILGRDLFPQVFYDFRAIVRFLRANADRYAIDPDRIGAWGFSAGGWLSSSASFCEAGDIYLPEKRFAIGERWPLDDPRRRAEIQGLQVGGKLRTPYFLVPMDDARPLHGASSARIQALQADFHHYHANITPAAPALCTYVGDGGVSDLEAPARSAGVDFFPLLLRHPTKNFKGANSVHVPPLTMKVPAADGKSEIDLADRVLLWFKERLVDHPAAPIPEFRPNRRVFADKVRVDIVVPSSATRIHYTTDGSTPTLQSPVWNRPLTITATTTITALAVRDGMQPSRPALARFVRGEEPPAIQGPKSLPRAKVGQPYEAVFTVEGQRAARWRLTAHYRPEDQLRYQGDFSDYSGLRFDADRGRLHGTPSRTGVFTLLVQAGWGPGELADTRTYVLVVE
jgi:hypothetical protein